MAYAILLVSALLLAQGVSASLFTETEENYIRELEENVALIPALLIGNAEAAKINIEPFSKISEAMGNLNIETFKSTLDYVEDNRVNNVKEFAKFSWAQYDYITEYLRALNKNDRNNMEALTNDARKRNVLSKITEAALQNNHLYFNEYYNDTFKTYANIPMCTTHRSRQQVIHDFYKSIVLTDLMGSVIRAIFIEVGEIPKTADTTSHSEFQKFLSRQSISYNNIKDAIVSASRSLYACDPGSLDSFETAKDKKFTSLDLHQTALYLPMNPYSGQGEEALTPCWKYSEQNNYCDFKSSSLLKIEENHRFCDAPKFILPFSASFPLTTEYQSFSSSDEVSRICDDHEPRGKHFCTSNIYHCISKDNKTDRYFHLGEVSSDSGDNKVVTGVRLVKEGNFFYIQIQQGKLGPRDSVEGSVEWKPIKNSITDIDSYVKTHPKYKYPEANQDFHIIHNVLQSQYVYLDDVIPPKNSKKRHAVTGLKFVEENGVLKLEVETKAYNYETGKLRGRNEWRGNNVSFESRKELVLEDPVEPIYYKRQYEISTPGTFVRFQGTTVKNSLEVSTVPFIDLQEVVTNPPSPVSGAGIFVKGTKGSGGYISLKLLTQDYAPNF